MIAGIFQLNTSFNNLETNLKYIAAKIENSSANIYILPELFNTGYELLKIKERSENSTHIINTLKALAAKFKCILVCGSIAETVNDLLKNTMYVIGPGHIITKYTKIHLFTLTGEQNFFSPGIELRSFVCENFRTGCAICYDLRFPELFIKYRENSCDLVILPANWPKARIDHWIALGKARAIENQIFIIGVNRIGKDDDITFGGRSFAYSPWGKELMLLGEKKEYFEISLDIKNVHTARKMLNSFQDRTKLC